MKATAIAAIKETVKLSLDGKITFPQVVMKLMNEGIEVYHVDLIRAEKRYYTAEGESHVEVVDHSFPKVTQGFSAERVKAAIQRIQQGKIHYTEFIEEIAAAGCVYYMACLAGKRVIYFGRNGDCHTEFFPKHA